MDGNPLQLYALEVNNAVVDVSSCRFYTRYPRALDTGFNIIVVINSNRCYVVSEKGNAVVYSFWYDAITGSLSGSASSAIYILFPYSFHVENTRYATVRLTTSGGTYLWVVEGHEVAR